MTESEAREVLRGMSFTRDIKERRYGCRCVVRSDSFDKPNLHIEYGTAEDQDRLAEAIETLSQSKAPVECLAGCPVRDGHAEVVAECEHSIDCPNGEESE